MLKSNLCEYKNAYISVTCDITIAVDAETQVAFRYFAPFTKSITKVNGITIDDSKD